MFYNSNCHHSVTTSIIFSSNKIQNEDTLVPTYLQGLSWEMTVKRVSLYDQWSYTTITEGLRERTEYVPQPGKLRKLRKSLVKPVTRQKTCNYYIELFGSSGPRSSCTTHLMLFSERLSTYASCLTISDGRTEQHVIIARFLPRHWLYEWFSRAKQPNTL